MKLDCLKDHCLVKNSSGRSLAEIHLDYMGQVQTLLLTGADKDEIRQIKELALYHAMNFVIERQTPVFGGLMILTKKNHNLRTDEWPNFMQFEIISKDIRSLDDNDLDQCLHRLEINILVSQEENVGSAISRVINQVSQNTGLSFIHKITEDAFGDPVILIGVGSGIFRFWKDLFGDHNIVPPYHPISNPTRNYAFLLNGDTSYCIRNKSSIKHVFPPPESIDESRGKSIFGSWQMKHPYKAEGQTFGFSLNKLTARTTEGINEITEFITAALDLNTYIAVSGGFRSRYTYPSNLQNKYAKNVVGSEGDIFWQYQVLKQEGLLEKSSIPKFFIKGRWLEAYENFYKEKDETSA